uniref:Coiled-coil domain-containing protein 172 n=1 Tax=Eptatretus burgeri TaxID=7764 RepID=A0A8C4ND23_EPTBU
MNIEMIFEEIIHSEQRALDDRCKLNEVKNKIPKIRGMIQKCYEDISTSEETLDNTGLKLCEEEMDLELLKIRQQSVESKEVEIEKEVHNLKKRMVEEKMRLTVEKDEFIIELNQFLQEYDVTNDAREERKQQHQEQFLKLKGIIAELEKDKNELMYQFDRWGAMKMLQDENSAKSLHARKQLAALETDFSQENMNTEALQKERIKVFKELEINPEYLKLKKELQLYKEKLQPSALLFPAK